jgi:hypothetical protein
MAEERRRMGMTDPFKRKGSRFEGFYLNPFKRFW